MSRARSSEAKRWPDVMIGVLTLALLGGFGALLLGQNKPQPVATNPAPQPAEANIPSSPGTVPEPATVTPVAPAATTPNTATPQPATPDTTPGTQATSPQTNTSSTAPATTPPQTPPQTADTAPATESPAATTPPTQTTPDGALAQTQEIPPVPKAPAVPPIKPPVVAQPAQPAPSTAGQNTQTPQAQKPDAATPSQQPAPATTATAPRQGGAVATSGNRTPLRSDYRISLGSFSSRRTVETQTANVRALGYTVHPIDLGDQYVAQIGPFADEATARQALADIQRAYPGALMYRPRAASSEASSGSASENAAASSAASSGSSASATTASTERPRAAAPSGPTYLQVGAFDRVESAQNLVGILKDNGFAPTVNNPPERKTTVLVGPYSGDALLRAEARLDNAGLDHFRVR